jgi:outer membrane immunogenic protein
VDYAGPAASLSFDADGFVGGAHGGYNWTMDGWVAGLEGNIDYVDGDATDTFGIPDTFESNWEAAIRARVGAFISDYLVYGAVGISWLDYDWTVGGTNRSQTASGWTWGGGVERAIPNSSMIVRLEYRRGEYDDDNVSFGGTFRNIEPQTQAVTAGLSFVF